MDIVTDVVEVNIFLLRKTSMKREETRLNFVNDTVAMIGRKKKKKYKHTNPEHYYVSMNLWFLLNIGKQITYFFL